MVASPGVDVYRTPCKDAAHPPLVWLKRCARFDYVVGTVTNSSCGDGSQYLMLRYRDDAGVLQYGWLPMAKGATVVDHCPSGYCTDVQPPEWSCRQVTASTGVTLFKQPCFDQSQRALPQDLLQWDTVLYYGAQSKQTSKCANKVQQNLCFVRASTTIKGVATVGWLPIMRLKADAVFTDTQCGFAGAVDQVFVRTHCGEWQCTPRYVLVLPQKTRVWPF